MTGLLRGCGKSLSAFRESLFDQHVYRSYKYIESKGNECPLSPLLGWNIYVKYRNFFIAQVQAAAMLYWEVDRALWAYGKHLKQAQKAGDRNGQHLGVIYQ